MRTEGLVVFIPLEDQYLIRRLGPCHEAVRRHIGLVLLDPQGGVFPASTLVQHTAALKTREEADLPKHIQDLLPLSVLTGENRLHDDCALSERRG